MTSHFDMSATQRVDQWFTSRGWKPFAFQRTIWKSYEQGQDCLLHSSTGSGKTYAAWFGPIRQFLRNHSKTKESAGCLREAARPRKIARSQAPPLTVLWLTPLRALSQDTEVALRGPLEALNLPWTLECRTGDSSTGMKARQRKRLPTALITTPESLTLLLSYPGSFEQFSKLRCIVVDEWHELMGTKRGTQTELALARLKKLAPQAVRIGLSATMGNLEQAMACLQGRDHETRPGKIVKGAKPRRILMQSLLPDHIERFPWAGHLGLSMAEKVVPVIEEKKTTLVFTNTRNQAEQWYKQLLKLRPDWAGRLALHHGSLDRQTRQWVENAVRKGNLLAVVCTSSLDLGVDFPTVEQVVQVGSPKGAARLIQRAGRSQHQPGLSSQLFFAPTNSLELLELAAARKIIEDQTQLESRPPLREPLDCLAQHAVSMALAAPYGFEELYNEVRHCYSYRDLERSQLNWVFRYLVHGGDSLQAYPEFYKVVVQEGQYSIENRRIARLHRMSIGSISSDMGLEVKYLTGKKIGFVEERFISRLKPGERFQFAGRSLQLVRIREGTAWVRRATKNANGFPTWAGGRMPLSSAVSTEIRKLLEQVRVGKAKAPEVASLRPLLELQRERSSLPAANQFLFESYAQRGRRQYVLFPFEGRLVHEGLAAIVSQRMSDEFPQTVTITVNDFGFMLETSCKEPRGVDDFRRWLNAAGMEDSIEKSLNATEMAKRQFREIARIAGLIHPGYPGQPKRARHLQAASNMFFEVFETYDSGNRFLQQAREEVLERQLEWSRLKHAVYRLNQADWIWHQPPKYSPFSFPLIVERMRDRVSSETLEQRVRRMIARMNEGPV